MSWLVLSKRIHNLSYAFKKTQVMGSLGQRYKLSPYTYHHVERYRPSFELRCHYTTNVAQEKKSWKKLMHMTALVFGLAGSFYAAVPLYQMFCLANGYDGDLQSREIVEETNAQRSKDGSATREIAVQFNVDTADGAPWKFVPMQREMMVEPGESAMAYYTAENQSSTTIVGVPTYKVTPSEAASYFKCICLEEQKLLPGQEVEMPVFFYIDPAIKEDPKSAGINSLSLSYTFVKVSK